MILNVLRQRYETHTFEAETDSPATSEIRAIGKYRGTPVAIPAPRALGVLPSKAIHLANRGVNYSRRHG